MDMDDLSEVVFFSNAAATVNGASRLFKVRNLQTIEIIPNSSVVPPSIDKSACVSLGTAAEAMVQLVGGGSVRVEGDSVVVEVAGQVMDPDAVQSAQFREHAFGGPGLVEVPRVEVEPGVGCHVYDKDSVPWIVIKEMVRRGIRERYKAAEEQQLSSSSSSSLWSSWYDHLPCLMVGSIFPDEAETEERVAADKIEAASHLVLLTAVARKGLDGWVSLGRTLHRLLAACAARGIAVDYIDPEHVAIDLKGKLGLPSQEHPALILRLGAEAQDLEQAQQHQPCLGVKDILLPL